MVTKERRSSVGFFDFVRFAVPWMEELTAKPLRSPRDAKKREFRRTDFRRGGNPLRVV